MKPDKLSGHQLCAAYTGLQVDIDRIRQDNESRKDEQRKGGLIIWSGRKALTFQHDLQQLV